MSKCNLRVFITTLTHAPVGRKTDELKQTELPEAITQTSKFWIGQDSKALGKFAAWPLRYNLLELSLVQTLLKGVEQRLHPSALPIQLSKGLWKQRFWRTLLCPWNWSREISLSSLALSQGCYFSVQEKCVLGTLRVHWCMLLCLSAPVSWRTLHSPWVLKSPENAFFNNLVRHGPDNPPPPPHPTAFQKISIVA